MLNMGRGNLRELVIISLMGLFTSCGAGAPGSSAAQALPEGNQVRNAGFEKGGAPAEAWFFDQALSSKGTASLDGEMVHAGKLALKLSPNKKNGGEQPLSVGQLIRADSLRGKKLVLSGWLGARSGAVAVVGLVALSKDGSWAAHATLRQAAGEDSGLRFHESTMDVPADRNVESLILFCAVEGQGGAAYFDDIFAGLQASSASNAPAARTEVPAGGLKATIAVDARQRRRTIPRTLYGTNVEWIFDGNLLWDKGTRKLHPEIIQLTRDLGVELVRFPGGVFSDYYHWRDGVGPHDSRKESRHYAGSSDKSRHNFGTDEALQFAAEVGGRLLITVNAGTGTPSEAAEWVRYVNGRNTGRGKVEFWEVGNELYIRGSEESSRSISIPPRTYAQRFLSFAKEMRAADPSIKIGAIGGQNSGLYSLVEYENWNREILQQAAAEIDFLAVHNGYAPVLLEARPSQDVRVIYGAMLAAPVKLRANLAEVSDQISKYAPKRESEIKLAVTEWGPLFQIEHDKPYVDHVQTLGSALYVASVLKEFVENPRMHIANFFKLNEVNFMGWIGPGESLPINTPAARWSYIAKAPYLAFQMYTKHFGEVLVRSSVESPTYNSSRVGLVDAARDVPYLEAVSSLSADGSTLYVMVINKHFDNPIEASVSLEGFEGRSPATVWTLNGTSIDANRGAKFPREFRLARQQQDPVNPRFDKAAPGEVSLTSAEFKGVAARFSYTFPAHSVTCLAIPAATATRLGGSPSRARR